MPKTSSNGIAVLLLLLNGAPGLTRADSSWVEVWDWSRMSMSGRYFFRKWRPGEVVGREERGPLNVVICVEVVVAIVV